MHLPDDDDELVPRGELDVRTAALQHTVAEVVSRRCVACGAALCGHGAVLAVVFGCKDNPRCAACLGREQREDPLDLAARALQWILRRDCFLHVWRRASEGEGHGRVDRPPCLFPAAASRAAASAAATAARATTGTGPVRRADATYDAGDLGCGDLVLELRQQLGTMAGGAVLHVVARDPAAPIDLPAWCGLVGHTLLAAEHPDYLIQRKRDRENEP